MQGINLLHSRHTRQLVHNKRFCTAPQPTSLHRHALLRHGGRRSGKLCRGWRGSGSGLGGVRQLLWGRHAGGVERLEGGALGVEEGLVRLPCQVQYRCPRASLNSTPNVT